MAEKTHASAISSYKNDGVGATQDLCRKKAELSVRKQASDEQLLKRRSLPLRPDDDVVDSEKIVQALKSQDLMTKTTAARAVRRMLTNEQNPPTSALVMAGIIAPLVDALERNDCTDLQFEAAWALANITYGTREHTNAVVDGGAIPRLVALLGGKSGTEGLEKAACALGNIAGDGPATRDAVLNQSALVTMLFFMRPDTPLTLLRTIVWSYSNMCRNKNPMVAFHLVAPALPYISELLTIKDQDVLADACWALSYLTDGPSDYIEKVQAIPHLTSRLLALLTHSSPSVRTPALRALGNMLKGTDTQTDRCLDAGCLEGIIALLRCGEPSLVKEAARAASNILAGTHPQIQRALDKNILEPLLNVLTNGDAKCHEEAACAIRNLCLRGTAEQLDAMLSAGFLQPYCSLLGSPDHRAVTLVLDGLRYLLQAAVEYEQAEVLCLKLEEIGVLDQIESLQQHENEQVSKKALMYILTYLSLGEHENAQPAQNEN